MINEKLLKNLKKGDFLSRQKIEMITGISYSDRKYSIACLQLSKKIEAIYEEVPIFTRIDKGGILLMKDAEADAYFHERQVGYRKRIADVFNKQGNINYENLSLAEKEAHLQRLKIDGTYLAAMNVVTVKFSSSENGFGAKQVKSSGDWLTHHRISILNENENPPTAV